MQTTRRGFIGGALAMVGLSHLVRIEEGAAQAACKKDVNLKTNAMAKNINYKEKLDLKKDKNLVNPDGSGKYCWTCILYGADGGGAPEKSKRGQCKLMMSLEDCYVKAEGGCTSWAKNPATDGKKLGA